MAVYEEIAIMKPEADPNQVQDLIERLGRIITSKGGKMKNVESLGMRDLAYPVKKYTKGKYYLLKFSAPSSLIVELSEITRYNSNVLRFLFMEGNKTIGASSSAKSSSEASSRGETSSRTAAKTEKEDTTQADKASEVATAGETSSSA